MWKWLHPYAKHETQYHLCGKLSPFFGVIAVLLLAVAIEIPKITKMMIESLDLRLGFIAYFLYLFGLNELHVVARVTLLLILFYAP